MMARPEFGPKRRLARYGRHSMANAAVAEPVAESALELRAAATIPAAEVLTRLGATTIFARVTPEQKSRVIRRARLQGLDGSLARSC